MLYQDFLTCTALGKRDLLAFSHGSLIQNPPADGVPQLPAPPFLMFDRITTIERTSRGGRIIAEQDIQPDAWYFQCHFRRDPVQPGCLGLDAIWQMIGLFCALNGAQGSGRALGVKEVEFLGQIRPFDQKVTYDVEIRRFSNLKDSGAAIAIANGTVSVDGQMIYSMKDAKVGVFKDIAYLDYPNTESPFARGGLMTRE